MPNREVHQKAKEKIESAQQHITNCSSGLAFIPDDEFVELLWENGDIVMKSQSNRARKCSLSSCFSSDAPKAEEKDEGDAVIPKIEKYSNLSSVMNNFSSPELVQEDEMVPWLNYPVHESLQNDYFAEFFTELTGTNLNSLSGQSNAVVTDSSSNDQVGIDANVVSTHGSGSQKHRNSSEIVVVVSEPPRIRSIQSSSAMQGQTLVPNLRPRDSEFVTNNDGINRQSMPRNLSQSPVATTGVPNAEVQKNDLASITLQDPSKNRGLINFSHFLRPAGLVKANMQGISAGSASCSSADRLKRNEEVSVSGSNLIHAPLVMSTKGAKSIVGDQNLPVSVSAKVDSKSCHGPPQELISFANSEATCQGDASRKNNNNKSSRGNALHQSLSFAASVAAQRSESEKALEPVVASSSMCSGNSAGGVSNEPGHAMKRKAGELEEFEYQSEDVEEESTDVKKPTKSTKRSRTAEVHNLSERRRRDRINEKMRALQELIPNCNKGMFGKRVSLESMSLFPSPHSKDLRYHIWVAEFHIKLRLGILTSEDVQVRSPLPGGFSSNPLSDGFRSFIKRALRVVDKASMLDEAIEYIKNLQLQMQMMSMGNRLFMPPVMLPAGIQHIGPPALPQFSPLGVGMGMGMGAAFAMGIPEANFSANCHMVPVPSIHGAQFPCPSVPGPSNLHGMQAPNLHMFGVSGQHLPFVHPHPPFFPFPGGFWSKEPSVPNVSGAATPVSNVDSSLPSGSKGQTENINLQTMHNSDTNCSQIRTSTEETKECSETGDLVQTSNPTSPVNSSGVMTSISKNGVTPAGITIE